MVGTGGGGVRGALTVAFLERIETLLKQRYGENIRLGDYFDLEPLTMRGPIIRYETIVLVKPMVEQVIELLNVTEE